MDYRTKYYVVKKLLFITLAGITLYFILKNTMFKEQVPELAKPTIIIDTVKIEVFSEANLVRYMEILEIEYPNIVLAQARLESGNFTSNRFKKYNALFGFQTSNTNVLKYKSWKESVINYKNWQMRRLKDGENYYDFLIRVKYSEDPNYVNKLKQF